MAISSMTGYARAAGAHDGIHWQWEVKSVNGKALDVRSRLPAGFEALEPGIRSAAMQWLKRGNLQVGLTAGGAGRADTVKLNRAVLDQIVAAGEQIRDRIGGEPLRADVLLGLRGVLEADEPEEDEAANERRNGAMLASLGEAFMALAAARREEGARLRTILASQIDRIESLARAARDNPARSPEAVQARLAEQVARLLDTATEFDADRLHQEAVLIATRADIQEELDRLFAHVEAARELLDSDDSIGRKLDFLAQEFNREANTLCSKAADKSLTSIGLELKTVIDQMREQVQNIE